VGADQAAGHFLLSYQPFSTVARVLRKLAANGKAKLRDYPLLIHIDEIINQGVKVAIP
jgi:glycerol-3-phosphate dehydrogenase (NAD(P)+)